MLGLAAVRVARQSSLLAEILEPIAPTGQQLVDIGLVARVPQDGVSRGVKDPVEGQGELDDTQVRSEVAARRGHRLDDE